MRVWIKRAAMAVGLLGAALLLVFGGYAAWALGHPAMPADTRSLPSSTAQAGHVTAHFFGTTTIVFDDGRDAVMIDAFLTRPGMATMMFGKVASDPKRIDAALGAAHLSRIDMLFVTHSHVDHALDIAAVAGRTGATIVGSPSTRQVALGGGVADARIVTIRGGEVLHAGDFTITVFKSLHSLGDRVPGELTAPLRQPASIKEYKEGGTFAFLVEHKGFRILVHASANAVPGMYRGVKADAVFLATGGLAPHPAAFTETYWHDVVGETGAKLVVPIHWDDFTQPLGDPLKPLPRMLDTIPLTMARIAPLAARDHVAIRYMPVIVPVDIEAATREGK